MSTGTARIRVLAVDDHPIVREGIGALVAMQPDMILVAEASDGREAIQQFRAHCPDVTVMDLQMPEMNGLDALIAIRNEFSDAKIIMLTTYRTDTQIVRALKAGAQGYLLKNALQKELLDTIRAAYAGKKVVSPEASLEIVEHGPTTLVRIGTPENAMLGNAQQRPVGRWRQDSILIRLGAKACSCPWVFVAITEVPRLLSEIFMNCNTPPIGYGCAGPRFGVKAMCRQVGIQTQTRESQSHLRLTCPLLTLCFSHDRLP